MNLDEKIDVLIDSMVTLSDVVNKMIDKQHEDTQKTITVLENLNSRLGNIEKKLNSMYPDVEELQDEQKRWGIYNTKKKEFQFGINEPSKKMARQRLFEKIGDDARKWRFEVREIK